MAEQKEILESIRDALKGGDDDILELTQKVNDDGSITEIAPKYKEAAQSSPPKIEPVINIPKTEPLPPPPTKAPAPSKIEEPASDDILSEIDSILNSRQMDEKVELEFTEKTEPVTKKFEIAEEFEAPEPEPAAVEPVAAAEPNFDGHILPRPQQEIEIIEEKTMDENITADDAKSSISELMGKLKNQGKEAQTPESISPFRSGTTMEDLVAEMLKPMMRDWLDKNLPKLVKETVQKEIQKLIPKE